MIGINVISIAQSVNLESGALNNILVLRLPDGTEVNAIVPETVVDKIYGMVNGAPAPPAEPTKFRPGPASWEEQAPASQPPAPQPPAAIPQQQEGQPPPEINWMALSDEQLPIHLKSAMKFLNVPEVLSGSAIRKLLEQIAERFDEEAWAQVMAKYPEGPHSTPAPVMPQQAAQPPPQPPVQQVPTVGLQRPPLQQPPQQPPLQAVQWSDGSPMLPGQVNRGRTVPANAAGFPIVNDGSVDPGEIVAGGEEGDEDGVAQF